MKLITHLLTLKNFAKKLINIHSQGIYIDSQVQYFEQ